MSGKPDKVEIRVKEYGGTYIATAREVKVRASCTSGADHAAHACARKIFGPLGYTLQRRLDGSAVWTASVFRPLGPAWNTGVPDADILVLIRLDNDEIPLAVGSYDGEKWTEADAPLICAVRGWMHLDTAARILDGAPF